MSSRIKILIGILVIIVIGIISWRIFVWTPMNIGGCKTDSDCEFTCGCGCIPKNKICPSYMLCKPTVCSAACRCLDGKCASWGDVYTEALKTKNIDLCKEIENSTCRDYCLENLSKDETANWKTYRNTKYGYEIKYPNDWDSPIESGDTDALTGNYSSFFKKENILVSFSINVYENDKNLSLKEWWEQEFYEKFTVKYEYSYEGVVPVSSGVEAVKYKIQRMGFDDNCYLISRNQRVYTIYFSVLPGAEEIQQILSTFRFL